MTKLNTETVHNTFMNCLFKDGEPTEIHTIGEGVKLKVGFHPERLKEAEPLIVEMLDGLHDNFKKTGGGGWSFLNMCDDRDGNHWGDHRTMDELVTLGIATGKIAFLMPRDMWEVLPGGVPYLVVC